MARLGKYLNREDRDVSITFNDTVDYSRTSGEYYPPGIDAKPSVNATVLTVDLGSQTNKAVLGSRKNSDQSLAQDGELRLFSSAGDVDIYLKSDGTIEIAGGGKSFMTYDSFADNWNALVSWLSTHTHIDSQASPTTAPVESIGPDISDISDSENSKVKTDG